MNVNDSSLPLGPASSPSSGPARAQETEQPSSQTRHTGSPSGVPHHADDVHLSELVRTLRSLAADSPERQGKIEALARSYAAGELKTDPEATASRIIDDAVKS
jgi:anti-sigma28 factor (negative regulator of flagellin synthesis)